MNEKNQNHLLAEIEGTVSGHRDGHGFVARDDGQPDIYLPSNEMRAVLHKDRVKVRPRAASPKSSNVRLLR